MTQIDTSRQGPSIRRLWGLSIAHLLADGYASFPAPLLTSLAIALDVDYAILGMLFGLNGASSGLANIVVGLFADRSKHLRTATAIIAATVAVVFMSLIGIAPSFPILAAFMISGVFACGAYHPAAFALAGDISHPHRHRGVSIVMTAGIAACGLGPIFVSQVVRVGGLKATPWCLIPGLVLAAIAAFLLRQTGVTSNVQAPRQENARAATSVRGGTRGQIILLFLNAASRSCAHVGVIVIVSFLVEQLWHMSVVASGAAIGCLQAGAGLGGLIGARLTRTGNERRTMLWAAPLNLLCLFPMAFITGHAWFACLFFYGLAVNGPGAVTISMGQRIAPDRGAFVSGLFVGPVWAVGGLLASLTTPRLIAEVGQPLTMAALAVPLVLSFVVAIPLRRER